MHHERRTICIWNVGRPAFKSRRWHSPRAERVHVVHVYMMHHATLTVDANGIVLGLIPFRYPLKTALVRPAGHMPCTTDLLNLNVTQHKATHHRPAFTWEDLSCSAQVIPHFEIGNQSDSALSKLKSLGLRTKKDCRCMLNREGQNCLTRLLGRPQIAHLAATTDATRYYAVCFRCFLCLRLRLWSASTPAQTSNVANTSCRSPRYGQHTVTLQSVQHRPLRPCGMARSSIAGRD